MRSAQSVALLLALISINGVARAQQPPFGAPPPAPPPAAPAPAAAAPVAPAPVAPAPVAPAPVAPAPAASAQFGAASGFEPNAVPFAMGFMVQARMQAQSSLLSLGGGPGFLVGYRGPTFAIGAGFGLTRVGFSTKEGGSTSGSVSILQFVPTVMLDIWHSTDGRARANVIGGIGYERASASVSSEGTRCTFNPVTGAQTCSPSTSTDSVGASLIPFMVGLGGDYYLSRNFSIGAEAGLQAAVLTSVDSTSNSNSQSFDVGGDMEFAYGVIRATMVLGD